jgi:hypothetical protein
MEDISKLLTSILRISLAVMYHDPTTLAALCTTELRQCKHLHCNIATNMHTE